MTHAERRERRKQMAAKVREGAEPETVAREFRVTLDLVERACKEFKVRLLKRKTGLRTFRIIALLLQGLSVKTVAEQIGVTYQWVKEVRSDASEAGITFPIER